MLRISDRAFKTIHENRIRREQGLLNCIPFGLPRLEEFVPGVQRKNYVIITANSGIGKSKLAKNLFVLRPYEYLANNPQAGMKMKTFYFCLEESREKFIHYLMVYQLWKSCGKRVPIKDILSTRNTLTIETERTIEEIVMPWLYALEESLVLVDNTRHPYGIYKTVKDYLEANGSWTEVPYTYYEKEVEKTGMKKDQYIPNDPELYVQVIVDHLNLLHPEKGGSLHEAMRNISSTYFVDLRDKYNCAITALQQQGADQEKKQYTFKGTSIESKLEPSLDGLGDCKLTQRDADEVYGLFAPDRYEIETHRGYNVGLLQDSYRSLSFLKTRDGEPNYRLGFLFDGAIGGFEELPRKEEMTEDVYSRLLEKVDRRLSNHSFDFSRIS